MISAGRLRHTVQIERNTASLDSYGDETDSWALFATRRASIEPIRGREYWTAQEQESEITHRIMMRYDSKIGTITTKDRLRFKTRIFDIKSVLNNRETNRTLEIMAIERV